jgi:hypothetical protein
MHIPSPDVRRKVAQYFAAVLSVQRGPIELVLPQVMTRWGKVRVANGGDLIHSASTVSTAQAEHARDSSYVQVRIVLIAYSRWL